MSGEVFKKAQKVKHSERSTNDDGPKALSLLLYILLLGVACLCSSYPPRILSPARSFIDKIYHHVGLGVYVGGAKIQLGY